MSCNVGGLSCQSVNEVLECGHSDETTEQYFHEMMFIMQYKMVLSFKSVDETLLCDHSNESQRVVLSCGTV